MAFPYIRNLSDLSRWMHLSKRLLYGLTHNTTSFYKRLEIPKRDGSRRTIWAPSRKLKAAQAWILRNILDGLPLSDSATGFAKGRSTRDHAAPHCGHEYLLRLDVKDFFDSIGYAAVFRVFRRAGYGPHASHLLSDICTREGHPPQGAVTSPALSNLVCLRMDRRICGYCMRRNIQYTRYADDMAFSTSTPGYLAGVPALVSQILEEDSMQLNAAKTRFMGTARRRTLAGLVVGRDSVGLGAYKRRLLRCSVHRLALTQQHGSLDVASAVRLRGWFSYARAVDPSGYTTMRDYIVKLDRKRGTTLASSLVPTAELALLRREGRLPNAVAAVQPVPGIPATQSEAPDTRMPI